MLDSLIVWKLFGWELFGLLTWDTFAGELNEEENGKKNHKKENISYYDVLCITCHSKLDLLWQVIETS